MKASDIVELGIAQVLEGRRIFSELTVNENLRIGGHTASRDIKENMVELKERRSNQSKKLEINNVVDYLIKKLFNN